MIADSRAVSRAALRLALKREEFALQYQPQLDLRRRRVSGVEALLRWKAPELGMVPPASFIPVAEETGLIVPIGDWALRAAWEQSRAWARQGLARLSLSVNVSARQFLDADLLDLVARATRSSGLEPGQLDLEITESIAMDSRTNVTTTLRALRASGVKVSIDDFGTGYSSLSQLKCCPADRLKIDGSFVRNLGADPIDEAVVKAVIMLAHSLRMTVIAEGVETAQQLERLETLGCDEVEGFLVSRPVAPEQIPAIVRQYELGASDCRI